MHKTAESGVVVRKTHRHQNITNDIGDGNRENRVKINGVVPLRLQHAQELLHLLHDALLHQSFAVAEESHAEKAETIVEESALFLPHFAGSVNHACYENWVITSAKVFTAGITYRSPPGVL